MARRQLSGDKNQIEKQKHAFDETNRRTGIGGFTIQMKGSFITLIVKGIKKLFVYFLRDIIALKKILGDVSVILQKYAQCRLSDFSKGFAVKCFSSDSWQIFTSFIGNFQINSENIHIQGVDKACFQILKGKRII